MFYRDFAEVANHLNDESLDVDGVLERFCMRSIAGQRFLASFMLEIGREGELKLLGFYGASPDIVGLSETPLTVFTDHPASESIRTNSMIVTRFQEDLDSVLSSKLKLVAWPIHADSRTIGSLIALVETNGESSDETIEYLEAISEVIGSAVGRRLKSRYQTRSSQKKSAIQKSDSHVRRESEELTDRQILILRLIAEGRTNGDIAEILGYSESLIRQETIRIYASLACNGRSDAITYFRNHFEGTDGSKNPEMKTLSLSKSR